MATATVDLFPFIETWNGRPAMSLNEAALCLTTMAIFHFIYVNANRVVADPKKAARVAPLIHAVYGTLASMYIGYYHSSLMDTPKSVCETLGPSRYFIIITWGYFLWDLFICLREGWSMDWVIHALFCVWMYGLGVIKHALYRWGMYVLFYEFSTIFLHCYTFLFYFGHKQAGSMLKVCFTIAFFFSRIILGSFITKECMEAFYSEKIDYSCIGEPAMIFVLLVNLSFAGLNLYWFSLIMESAIYGKPEKSSSSPKKLKKR